MTLIMLSVITVVAVAFLAMTQRERTAVSQSTQQSDAEIVADAAAERAKAEVFAHFLANNNNLIAADLLVSRNYIRTNGFIPGNANLTNVNYEFTTTGFPLNYDQMLENLANLYYDPRVPVFVNVGFPGGPEVLDFRFFLDLNRNRRFETNGAYPLLDYNGLRLAEEAHFIGDPEWVGVLENPLFQHSRVNRFIGRYAYIVLPIGKSLDINFMHNHGKTNIVSPSQDAFFRNQGFGSWELNLAAFLADLNTNVWGQDYFYTNGLPSSTGFAFTDALEIYNTRVGAYGNLAPADQILRGGIDFGNDFIDAYANGPLEVTGKTPTSDNDNYFAPWPGSHSRTNFFTPHDFFDILRPLPRPTPPPLFSTFTSNLVGTTLATASYDRYTFYRMLAQLSTDSASELPHVDVSQLKLKLNATNRVDFVAEPAGKINLNYANLYPLTASDMAAWDTNVFFNTVADVLLSSLNFSNNIPGTTTNILSITHIPIYPTNYYSITVHRMLQMAANIYDVNSGTNLPSVFRPIVVTNATSAHIAGYYYDDYYGFNNLTNYLLSSRGLPMIIGAKKCLPNFNEYSMETAVMAARKLEFRRLATNQPPHQTNEMYIIGISNVFGVEAWNSCTNGFTNDMVLQVINKSFISLTNNAGVMIFQTNHVSQATNTWPGLPRTVWPGFRDPDRPSHPMNAASFWLPLNTANIAIPNSVYRFGSGSNVLERLGTNNQFAPTPNAVPSTFTGFRIPDWHLTISNDLVYVLAVGDRIIDFVHLADLTNHIDVTAEFVNPAGDIAASLWDPYRNIASVPAALTNTVPTRGIQKQIDISMIANSTTAGTWKDFAFDVQDKRDGSGNFRNFVEPALAPLGLNSNLVMQAPFSPARKLAIRATWDVNDPLVHYLPEHLKGKSNNYEPTFVRPFMKELGSNQSLGELNSRYEPWRPKNKSPRPELIDHRVKDPGITKSDDWDFPTNKFASIGWLGRVHRGTPWQTIYLKAEAAPEDVWRQYSLDPLSHPTNDWRLLDVFSVAIHENASRGQLSINQTNFAAWSAVLSGVVALSNIVELGAGTTPIERYEPVVIEPGSPALLKIYEGIQKMRDRFPDKTFRRLGDILAVHELTQGSPYLDTSGVLLNYPAWGINDTAMERIPQQILSLLKVGDPRYVIYAYGQSLRPAENSILTSGNFAGMCTNYQVTGEFVTRTVLQIEGTAGNPRPVVKSFNILSAD